MTHYYYVSYVTSIIISLNYLLMTLKTTKAIKHQSGRAVLQHSLDALCEWSTKWELSLSLEKCIYLQLGYTDETITYKFLLIISNFII